MISVTIFVTFLSVLNGTPVLRHHQSDRVYAARVGHGEPEVTDLLGQLGLDALLGPTGSVRP